MQIPFPKNHFILLPPRTNTIPTIDQQHTFPYNSRTIPVLFPYNKADHDQRRSMTYQSTILGNFCCNKTIVSVFVSKNNVENQLLFAQFKEKQYLCPRNRRWGCGWAHTEPIQTDEAKVRTRRALRSHIYFDKSVYCACLGSLITGNFHAKIPKTRKTMNASRI